MGALEIVRRIPPHRPIRIVTENELLARNAKKDAGQGQAGTLDKFEPGDAKQSGDELNQNFDHRRSSSGEAACPQRIQKDINPRSMENEEA
jgi:hypothetical protein